MTAHATASSGAYRTARQTDSYVVAVMNQKGGIGKSMLVLSMAAHTAAANGRALAVDVDPQSTTYDMTRMMANPGYDVISELDPAELTRLRQLRDYDTILVDCPGSLEGRAVLDQVLKRSTYVIVPYDHEPETIGPTLRTAAKAQEAGVPYGAVVTKVDPRLGEDFVKDAWATLEAAGIRHFRSFIPLYRAWPNSLKAGVPITRFSERYAPRVREAVSSLHTELLLEIGRRVPAGRS
jgi:chromosome partitioning protein